MIYYMVLCLNLGNDAAVSLAEFIGGDLNNFSNLMNYKANELGLKNTHFVTPHGLDDQNHYSTAFDLAILTDYALQNEKFAEIVNTKVYTININRVNRTISNTNELLGNLNGVNGVKTGFTANAMRCLITSCTRDGNQIITVVLGADTKKDRTSDSIKLIEYAFSNFKRVNIRETLESEFNNWIEINKNRLLIRKAQNNNIEFELSKLDNDIIPLNISSEASVKDKKDVHTEINIMYDYTFPIKKGEKLGNIVIKYGDDILDTVDVLNKTEIRHKNIQDYMLEFFRNLSTCLDFYA